MWSRCGEINDDYLFMEESRLGKSSALPREVFESSFECVHLISYGNINFIDFKHKLWYFEKFFSSLHVVRLLDRCIGLRPPRKDHRIIYSIS